MDSGATEIPDQAGSKPPNPGSVEAKALGCKCPSQDNNGGKLAPFPPDGWWIRGDCPLHGPFVTQHDLDPADVPGDELPPRP